MTNETKCPLRGYFKAKECSDVIKARRKAIEEVLGMIKEDKKEISKIKNLHPMARAGAKIILADIKQKIEELGK